MGMTYKYNYFALNMVRRSNKGAQQIGMLLVEVLHVEVSHFLDFTLLAADVSQALRPWTQEQKAS